MNYTIFDNSDKEDSSALDSSMLWSVILFGDHIHFATPSAYYLIIYPMFRNYDEKTKFSIYRHFKYLFDQTSSWEEVERNYKHLIQLRNKKHKNGYEMADYRGGEAWIRRIEQFFLESIEGFLKDHFIYEMIPLTEENEKTYVSDLEVTYPSRQIRPDSYNDDHFINIISLALSQEDGLLVLNDTMDPFIKKVSVDHYNNQPFIDGNQAIIFEEHVLNMPLCYKLNTSEIRLARKELTESFKKFHESLYRLALQMMYGTEEERSSKAFHKQMSELRSLLPDLQNKIDGNTFITKYRNEVAEINTVDIHLAFTSNNALLLILQHLDFMAEEDVLLAREEIQKESDLDRIRPFIYITK